MLYSEENGKIYETKTLASAQFNLRGFRYPISVLLYPTNVMLHSPFVIQRIRYSNSDPTVQHSWFYGFGGLSDFYLSPQFFMFNIASLIGGHSFHSADHKQRLSITTELNLSFSFNYNFKVDGKKVVSATLENGFPEKVYSTTLVPLNAYVTYERHLYKQSFLLLKTGMFLSTNMSDSDVEWYYSDEFARWHITGNSPQPIDGEPEHPALNTVTPYFGVGISF
jgi:hypothetical protein